MSRAVKQSPLSAPVQATPAHARPALTVHTDTPLVAPTPAALARDATLHNAGNTLTLAALAGEPLDGLGGLITEALTLATAGVVPEAGPGIGSNEAALSVMRRAKGEGVDHAALGGLRPGGGRPLPPAVVGRLSAVFGHDLSHVRVHEDAQAARLAEAAQARAFTVGHEIWFNAGELELATPYGLELLLHELTHVIQADQGRAPRPSGDGVDVSSPHDPHEQEAERTAAALLPALDLYGDGLSLSGDGLLDDAAWSAAVDLGPSESPGQDTALSREGGPEPGTSPLVHPSTKATGRLLVMWDGETPIVIRAPPKPDAETIAAAFAEAGVESCANWQEVSSLEPTYPLFYALMLAREQGESAVDFVTLAPLLASLLSDEDVAALFGGGDPAVAGGVPEGGGDETTPFGAGSNTPGGWSTGGGDETTPFGAGNKNPGGWSPLGGTLTAGPGGGAGSGGVTPQVGGGMAPGKWAPPGKQPIHLYRGNAAHTAIGQAYFEANNSDTVYLNHIPVKSIVEDLAPEGNPNKLSARSAGLKPDILNASERCVYEIKPANALAAGVTQAAKYVAAFAEADIEIALGSPAMPGTSGVLQAPLGFFHYECPVPGVIIYRYTQVEPMPAPVPVPAAKPAEEPSSSTFSLEYWEEVTGLTGVALVIFLVLWEGPARLYLPRWAFP